MGPLVLFDKSFLQSLTVDESVWFDNFFRTTICPLFYVETLADLEKTVRHGRTQEQEVSIIAKKFPEVHSTPCLFHQIISFYELLGYRNIPMDSRIPVGGGSAVKANEKTGVVYEISPEANAFQRWQQEKFYDLERDYAKRWRENLERVDLKFLKKELDELGVQASHCKTLVDVFRLTQKVVNHPYSQPKLLQIALSISNIPQNEHNKIYQRWVGSGMPPLSSFSPYTFLNLIIEIFFQNAIAASLISNERASNRADISYLFYLPFCNVFVSSDKLHKKCAPLFLRENQSFQWGIELKSDLKKINEHYASLPNLPFDKGIFYFAKYPPRDQDLIVAKLWDKYIPNWRQTAESYKPPKPGKKLVKRIKEMSDAPTSKSDVSYSNDKDIDFISIHRSVRKKKGSWFQLPKNIKAN